MWPETSVLVSRRQGSEFGDWEVLGSRKPWHFCWGKHRGGHMSVSQVRWCRLERNTHASEEQLRGQYRQTDSPTPSPRLLHCLPPSKLTQKEITQAILNSLHAHILPGSPNRTKWEAIDPSSQQKRPTNHGVPQLPSSINSGYDSFTSKIFYLISFFFFDIKMQKNWK